MASLLSLDDLMRGVSEPEERPDETPGLLSIDDLVGGPEPSGAPAATSAALPFVPRETSPGDTGGVLDIAASTARAVPRGVLETTAVGLEAPALSRRGVQTQVRGLAKEGARVPDMAEDDYRSLLRGLATSGLSAATKAEIAGALGAVRQGRIKPEDMPDFAARFEGNLAQDARDWLRATAANLFPIPPEHEERLAVQVGRGVGSTVPFLLARLLPGGQAFLPITALGLGQGEAIQRAAAAGAGDEEQARVAFFGSAPGLTDVVPIENLFRAVPMAPGVKGAIYGIGRKMVEQGLIEGTQEAAQEFMQNAIERYVSARDVGLFDDTEKSALVGALVGVIFGGGAAGISAATRPKPPGEIEQAAATPPPVSPADEASPIPTDIIAEGRAAVADAEATQSANDILRRNDLPAVGTRVAVTLPDGETAAGTVSDSFTETNAELGLEEDGIKIALDDGGVFEEFVTGLSDRGIEIVPETVAEPTEQPEQAPAPEPAAAEPEKLLTIDELVPTAPEGVATPAQAPSQAPAPIPGTPAPAEAETAPAAPVAPVKPIYEMTEEELRASAELEREREANIDREILGEDGAKAYQRAQRRANSQMPSTADRGIAEVERIEATLTNEQLDRLAGVGEPGSSAEDYREFARALNEVDDDSAEALGGSLRFAITRVGEETDPTKMTRSEQIAYAQLRRGFEIARERNFDTAKVTAAAIQTSASRFSDPNDAAFMLRRFSRVFESKQETPDDRQRGQQVRRALAQGPEPGRVVDEGRGQAPAQAGGILQKPGEIQRGAGIAPREGPPPGAAERLVVQTGVVLRTKSGRETTPAPKVEATTERKTKATLRRIDEWLASEAIKEAEATNNDFLVDLMKGINPARMSPADRDSVNEVLFGADAATQANVVRVETKQADLKRKIQRRRAKPTAPRDVLGVIREMGGIRPDANLAAMDLRKARPGTVVGQAKGGRSVSDIRERLEELGMLPEGSFDDAVYGTIRSALFKEPGRPVAPGDEALVQAREDARVVEENAVALEEARGQVRSLGREIGEPLDEAVIGELAQTALTESRDAEDVLSDYAERQAIANLESFSDEAQDDDYGDIPFLPAETGPAPSDQEAGAGQPGPAVESRVEGQGAAVPEGAQEDRGPSAGEEVAAAEPTTEPTDQGEQAVIPGAERTTGREFVEAQAEKRIKGRKPQKAADEGLFDVAGRRQKDLFTLGPVNPRFAADAARLGASLQARLKQLGIADKVALRLVEDLQAMVDGRATPAEGRFTPGLIEISLAGQDGAWVLDHEAIHALRELGLFRPAEWTALTKAAKADTERMKRMRAQRKGQGLTEEQIVEEVIADMFADWAVGRTQAGGFLRTAFERVRDFLTALGRALTRRGYTEMSDIFGAVERGEVGRRQPVNETGPMGMSQAFMDESESGNIPFDNAITVRTTKDGLDVLFDGTRIGDAKGFVSATILGSELKVKTAVVGKASRGQGVATQLYLRLIDEAQKRDLVVASDETLTPISVKLWKSLRRRGFNVVEQPGTKTGKGGGKINFGDSVFRIAPSKLTLGRPISPTTTFDKAETERRWQDARKGAASQETIAKRLGDWLTFLGHGFTRHYINLPNEARFAEAREQFRKLEAAPQASKEQVIRILRQMTDGMSASDLDLFTRKVVLDDLSHESDQDHDLPFAMTPSDVASELAKVDRTLADRPDLQAKVRQRKLIVRGVANQLVEAGVLHREQIKNPAYYRHQVLDYARAQVKYAQGAGQRVRTPHWARRMGSMLDINANLLEAEFEWLHKALTDIATAKTIDWVQKSEHNVRDEVIAAARAHNETQVQERLAQDQEDNPETDKQGRPTSPLTKEWRKFRQNIAFGMSTVRKAIEARQVTGIPREFQGVADGLTEDSADNEEDLFPFLAWMMDNDKAGAAGAGLVFKTISQRKQWTKDLLGRGYADPNNVGDLVKRFAPEGHVAWQPDEGHLLFTAKTIPEHVMDRMLERIAESGAGAINSEELLAALNSVRDILAVGGPKYQMVLPEEIANTLNSIRAEHSDSLVEAVLENPLRWWKRWVLINPRRVLRYNLNNLSGDIDAVIAGNPRALRHMPRAIKELYQVMLKGETPSPRYREAVERGVFDSGLTVQEIPDINFMADFEQLINAPSIRQPGRFALSGLMKVWRGLQRYTWFRENWLRYAAYLDYVERLEGGEAMTSIGYGAARREMVDAVRDDKDRAALLARELVGDYGAISHWGVGIRRKIIPFYSWLEINTKRYWRLGINAWGQGVGEGLRTTGIVGAVFGARTTAYLGLRMALLYGMVQVWNNLVFGDEEDELRTEDRVRLHLNLGRNDDGEIRLVRFQGALSDFLAWVGFENAVHGLVEIERGRGSWNEVAKAVAKAPVNKIGSGLTPVLKMPIELTSGYSFWPDVFRPRPIRDKGRHVARLFSVENEYDVVFDRPSRGFGRSLAEAALSRRNVGETAYGRMKSLAHDFVRRLRGSSGTSSFQTDRSRALHEWRLAKKFGDESAAKKARAKLTELGVTGKDLQRSIKRAHPLGGVPIKDRGRFLRTLTPRERKSLDLANRWYRETYLTP